MNLLIDNLYKVNMYKEILDALKEKNKDISFKDIMDSQKALYIYSITKSTNESSLVVCSNILTAKKMIQDLKFFSDLEIVYFPAKPIIYYDIETQSREIENDRMYALKKINEKGTKIVVTTIDTLMLPMFSNITNEKDSIIIRKNEDMDFNKLICNINELRISKS